MGKIPVPAEKQLYIALYVLDSPESYRSVVSKFDVGRATASRAILRVVQAVCNFKNHFIHWPTLTEAESTFHRIQEKYGFPKVLGAVDGAHKFLLQKGMLSLILIERASILVNYKLFAMKDWNLFIAMWHFQVQSMIQGT